MIIHFLPAPFTSRSRFSSTMAYLVFTSRSSIVSTITILYLHLEVASSIHNHYLVFISRSSNRRQTNGRLDVLLLSLIDYRIES